MLKPSELAAQEIVDAMLEVPKSSTSFLDGGGGGWHVAMVCCYRLQLAAPIGQSPFTALPLDPFPP